MPQFTFEDPSGQRHTIEGPEGATRDQAFGILQQHLGQSSASPQTPGLLKSAASGLIQGAGAPGDLSSGAGGLGALLQKPIDKETYYGKLVDALNVARRHLELPTTEEIGNTVGMKPTSPVTMPEKIVQGAANMIPGALLGGSPVGRAMMGAAPAASAVRGMAMSPQGPASSIAQGAAQAAPQGAGDALQSQLLKAGLEHGASAVGHMIGGPMVGKAAKAAVRYIPKVLGLD